MKETEAYEYPNKEGSLVSCPIRQQVSVDCGVGQLVGHTETSGAGANGLVFASSEQVASYL
jgi:hypothetical protein